MSIKDLTQKSFSVLIIRSFGVLLLFGLTMFLTNFYSAENVGRYDFVRSTIMVLGGLTLMGTNQSIIYYSGLLKARKSIESISDVVLLLEAQPMLANVLVNEYSGADCLGELYSQCL